MSHVPVQLSHGTAAQLTTYTGPANEIVVNTDDGSLHVQDGSTAGGKTKFRGLPPGATLSLANSLGSDVNLNNTSNYFDGPSVAQGTSGIWFASGTVTLQSTAADSFLVKLWDGTTVIASLEVSITAAGGFVISASLSGVISSPAANIRISVCDPSSTAGKIRANASGLAKDSTLTVFRIG